MRRSSFALVLSALAFVACSSGGASTEQGSANGASPDGGQSASGNVGQDDSGSPLATGGGGSHDAGADSAMKPDAAPQTTGDGCVITASPADDACVLRDELGVFVSASKGSDAAGDGSMAQPFATAAHGITFAKAHQKRVFLCAETYAENITIENGVSVFGGLDCSQPKWTVSATRAHFAAPASPAARADNVTTTTAIEAVEIFAPDATVPSGSSIGMIANASPGVLLRNVWIQAGNAMNGVAGTEAAPNVEGAAATGPNQLLASTCGFVDCINWGVTPTGGGVSSCGGSNGGGGGPGGYFVSTQKELAWIWNAQQAYLPGAGNKGGGVVAKNGANGSSNPWHLTAEGFVPGDGSVGGNGTPGPGGNGGSGDAPNGSDYDVATHSYLAPGQHINASAVGASGSGGGAGGCPGIAGTAGTGGGASIALLAISSGLTLKSARLTSSAGGSGGSGTFGSAATKGSPAGVCAHGGVTCGTAGGAGGESGVSGSGVGGPSLALAYQGVLPTVDALSQLAPGTGGAGVGQQVQGAKVINATANGASQAIYSF